MKKLSALFLIATLLFSCKKEEILSETDYVSGQTYENGLRIDGNEFDGLLIENCTFRKKPLNIGNVQNVIVRNCIFENINDNGIKVGFIGEASNIVIEDCTFKNIGYNGIDSHERALDCKILNCFFENIALSEVGASMGQPHHGIYWKGKNVTISGNQFINGDQPFGNAISVRSSGVISGNKIRGAAKNGIMYYADHPGDDSLIIENNFISNSRFYSIIMGSNGNEANHNKNVIIRFNSSAETENESIYIAEEFENTTNISIYGNILVNSNASYYKTFFTINDSYSNLESTSDIGFIDMNSGNLHITPSSSANSFCNGLSNFPTIDIDGEVRVSTNLDAGADEIN
jgi:hypothetical protein